MKKYTIKWLWCRSIGISDSSINPKSQSSWRWRGSEFKNTAVISYSHYFMIWVQNATHWQPVWPSDIHVTAVNTPHQTAGYSSSVSSNDNSLEVTVTSLGNMIYILLFWILSRLETGGAANSQLFEQWTVRSNSSASFCCCCSEYFKNR